MWVDIYLCEAITCWKFFNYSSLYELLMSCMMIMMIFRSAAKYKLMAAIVDTAGKSNEVFSQVVVLSRIKYRKVAITTPN